MRRPSIIPQQPWQGYFFRKKKTIASSLFQKCILICVSRNNEALKHLPSENPASLFLQNHVKRPVISSEKQVVFF